MLTLAQINALRNIATYMEDHFGTDNYSIYTSKEQKEKDRKDLDLVWDLIINERLKLNNEKD